MILKSLSDKDLADSIDITGFVAEDKLPLYFSAADVIVLPYTESDVLGISEVLAEVAPMGKPIVGTRTPKLIGTLRNKSNSLLVDPGNVEQLASALLQLLGDEQLGLRLGNNLKREASDRTWDKIGLMTVAVYKDVTKEGHHGRPAVSGGIKTTAQSNKPKKTGMQPRG
jgi:glycosyltransferase involved in cell wall biosynthesis